jgi:hypothetical protein
LKIRLKIIVNKKIEKKFFKKSREMREKILKKGINKKNLKND